jgi:hypothetical protein
LFSVVVGESPDESCRVWSNFLADALWRIRVGPGRVLHMLPGSSLPAIVGRLSGGATNRARTIIFDPAILLRIGGGTRGNSAFRRQSAPRMMGSLP